MVKFEKPNDKKFNNGDKVVYMDVYVYQGGDLINDNVLTIWIRINFNIL